jgi:hypothetical protein
MQLAAAALGTTLEDLDPEAADAAIRFQLVDPKDLLPPVSYQAKLRKVRARLGADPDKYLQYLRRMAVARSQSPRRKGRKL